MHRDRSQEPFCVDIYRRNAGPQAQKSHFVWKFKGEMPDPKRKRAILCGNLQEKCQTQIPRTAFCASLRNRNAHEDFRAILCGNLQENSGTRIPRSTFCARLRWRNAHGHVTRAIFLLQFTGKMVHTTLPTSITTGPFTVTVRTPSVWPHCLGKKLDQIW